MESTSVYEQERLAKVAKLRELGVAPYGAAVEGVGALAEIKALYQAEMGHDGGPDVVAAGRVILKRDMGKLSFLTLRDETGDLQVALDKKRLTEIEWKIRDLIDLGDLIVIHGKLGQTNKGETTIWAAKLDMAAKALLPPPAKWEGLSDVELRYRQRYVDLWANPQVMRVLKLRIQIVNEIRRYMADMGYVEVETPMMQTLAGGAAARPFQTHHNALDIPLYLRIAPELYLKRLLVGGFNKVFELNRNFRNEGISPRHNPEFTMLEAYEAFGSWETMADLVEGMVCHIAEKLFGDLKIVHPGAEGVQKTINLQRPWRRVRMVELVEERTGWKFDKRPLQEAHPELLEKLGQSEKVRGYSPAEQLIEVYEKLIEHTLVDPCFVTHLPSVTIPLARENRDDPYFADVYELAINGQEISPGYSELNDPEIQAKHFAHQVGDQAEQQKTDDDFLNALRYGMPPAGGLGMGIDRLVMMLTGAESIRDVILFPLMKPLEKNRMFPLTPVDKLIAGLTLVTAGAVIFALIQMLFGPRVLSLLVFRYLRKRRIAWVSLIAVMLCTMMVLVVISVMGGWLRMFRETNHGLIGDLTVYRNSLTGFAHYQEMIDRIEDLPEVKAAAPQIHTYGLIDILGSFGTDVEVRGIDPKAFAQVNGFVKSLHLQPDQLKTMAEGFDAKAAELDKKIEAKKQAISSDEVGARIAIAGMMADAQQDRDDARAVREKIKNFPSYGLLLSPETYREQAPLRTGTKDPATIPGMIVGSGVIGLRMNDKGQINRPSYMYTKMVKLTSLATGGDVSLNPENVTPRLYWIIDDSRTQVYQVDAKTVYVPFDLLQQDLKMGADKYTDATTGQQVVTDARANEIEISLKDPSKVDQVKPEIARVVDEIAAKYGMVYSIDPIVTETWEERQADFLHAVEHEEGLLVILFGIISVVAVFLIFCIFFMIVVEKTRDIGIIKSVGVTSAGVAGIFLGYGLAIGIVGGGMGLLGGWLIVHYINQIHGWIGRETGLVMWDAKTYLFDTIPNRLDPKDAAVIVSIAILASVLGALVPAIRAARMNPVEALRFE